MKKLLFLLSGIAAMSAVLVGTVGPTSGADHGDAPLAKANHPEDLADVYAFAGGGSGTVVLAITVNPLTMPGDTPTFDSAGLYQFRIDNNGDAVPDVTYNVTFTAADSSGQQTATVKKATGTAADTLASSGSTLISGKTTAGTNAPVVTSSGNVKLFAGLRDDPFLFDLNAFKAGLAFRNPGNNFFKGLNVSGIVLEVPARNVTSCCFGGDDGRSLSVTTAAPDGNVYVTQPGISGPPAHVFHAGGTSTAPSDAEDTSAR